MNDKIKTHVCDKTGFNYIQRGIDRTPKGEHVFIVETSKTVINKPIYGLHNKEFQFIAHSQDVEDLELLTLEYDWVIYNSCKKDNK